MKVLEKRGWDLSEVCLSFVGYEGGKSHVAREKSIVKDIIGKHGGIALGKGPGALYDQKKFDTPYIRDFLLDRGAAADVSETAAPWSKLLPLYTNVIAAGEKVYAQLGTTGYLMCHLSHSYHSGACLYFTFAFRHDGVDPLAQYDQLKSAIQQQFVDSDATLSHHHAVGTEHARWLEEDISAPGVAMIDGLFAAVDPGRNFNPGKITPNSPCTSAVLRAPHLSGRSAIAPSCVVAGTTGDDVAARLSSSTARTRAKQAVTRPMRAGSLTARHFAGGE